MKIEYKHTFGLPKKVVWKYMKDAKVLESAIPNCRSFVQSTTGLYHAEIDINIGPLKDMFTLDVKVEKEKAPIYYHLLLKGKGNLGEVSGKAILLFNEKQGSTLLDIQAEVNVTGTLSAAAEKVISGGANKGIEKFFQSIEKEIKKNLYLMRKGRK